MKILEIVKINNRFGFVVDEAAPLVYHEEFVFDQAFKRTEHMLVGESADGRMVVWTSWCTKTTAA